MHKKEAEGSFVHTQGKNHGNTKKPITVIRIGFVSYAKKFNVLPTFLQDSYSYTLFFLLFGLIICAVSSLRDRILILSVIIFRSKKGRKSMKDKKVLKVTSAVLLLTVICIAAYLILTAKRGWETYASTDEYVQVCDYKAIIQADREEGKEKDEIWNEIVAYSEIFKYPDKELEKMKKENLANYEKLAKNSGYDNLDDFLDKEMSITRVQFDENSENFCKNKIAETLVLYRIAALEDIHVEDAEYEQYLAQLMEANGLTEEGFKETYGDTFREYAEENGLRQAYLQDQVENQIFE